MMITVTRVSAFVPALKNPNSLGDWDLVKHLPAMRETWILSLGWEDPSGEGKAYPLQCSGLENSVDLVHGVTNRHN